MKRRIAVCGALCVLALLGGCAKPSPSPEHVFRYAENQAVDFPTTLAAYYFADRVSELTGGRIQVYIYPEEELGDERAIIEQMQYGGIDFGRVNLSPLAEYDNRLYTLQLPYLYEDSAHMWRVLDGEIGDAYLETLSDMDIVGLAWVDAGARSFYTRGKPVYSLEDMQGLRIRVQENEMMERLIELLGAEPVRMRYSEVLPALQTGKIDGAENNYPSYRSTGHYLVARYMLEDEHARVPEVIIASAAVREKLSQADWALVVQAAQEAAAHQRVLWQEFEARTREEAIASGCEIYEMSAEERQVFREITEQMYGEFAAGDDDVIERIDALRE